jgi:hypothetical protein
MDRAGRLVAAPLLAALIAAALLLAVGLFPADLPVSSEPSFLDTIFDNRGVIWASRLLLVSAAAVLAFGGVFVVASTVVRMKNGDWLRRAGPFEVSETAAGEIEGEAEFWRDFNLAQKEVVAELTERLNRSDELIERLRTLIDDD